MPVAPLVPARLEIAPDGTPHSTAYGDVYHSADGALEQARHVFLRGNGLPRRWSGRERFVILETGFGLGLNFLATWAAWRDDPGHCARLHFVSIEKHPFARDDLDTLHSRWPELGTVSAELRAAWPLLVPGLHRLSFDDGRVTLTLAFGDVAEVLPKLRARADAIFLDGFAPQKNPEMWSPAVFRALARLACPGATLATWTVAASVRDGLAVAGFTAHKGPGFASKRDMLTGTYAPARASAGTLSDEGPCERRVVVIGAGISGSAVADRLATRGWRVDVIERQAPPHSDASPDPLAGVFKPMLSRDDNIASRLSRAGCLAALRHWGALQAAAMPLVWAPGGVLQLARSADQEADQRALVEVHRYPSDFVSVVDRDEAARSTGWPVAQGGLLLKTGGWVNPVTLCRSQLLRHSAIRINWGCEAKAIARTDGVWRVLGADGTLVAEAPVLVLAAAFDSRAFPQASRLPLRRVRGQVTFVPAHALRGLSLVVCREGCVTPAAQGVGSVGATFDPDDDPEPRADGNESNLARLERLLPGAAQGLDPAALDGRVGFRAATPDRLPLAGALPDYEASGDAPGARLANLPRFPGLYGLLGLGARGLVWSAVGAELIASELEGEPLPIEADLAAAMDPGRFLLRAARRGSPHWTATEAS
jgi:tRNA 5-methylaminomethyl-2-thiouridine biosynthesis bifunctional protein